MERTRIEREGVRRNSFPRRTSARTAGSRLGARLLLGPPRAVRVRAGSSRVAGTRTRIRTGSSGFLGVLALLRRFHRRRARICARASADSASTRTNTRARAGTCLCPCPCRGRSGTGTGTGRCGGHGTQVGGRDEEQQVRRDAVGVDLLAEDALDAFGEHRAHARQRLGCLARNDRQRVQTDRIDRLRRSERMERVKQGIETSLGGK